MVVSRPVYELQAQGYPVEFVFPEDGTQVADNSMGILVGAPTRNSPRPSSTSCLVKRCRA